MRDAMQAVDQTHQVTAELRNYASSETLDEFRIQAQTLIKHLSTLKNVLDHQTAYTMDELVDVLSQFLALLRRLIGAQNTFKASARDGSEAIPGLKGKCVLQQGLSHNDKTIVNVMLVIPITNRGNFSNNV